MDVYETWGDVHPRDVDGLLCLSLSKLAQCYDTFAYHSDVCLARRRSRPVYEYAANEDQVKHGCKLPHGQRLLDAVAGRSPDIPGQRWGSEDGNDNQEAGRWG